MTVRRLKPAGRLKDYLDTTKRPTRLLGAVERHLLTRPPEHRAQDVLHPSEIVKHDFCQRAGWHALSGHTKSHSPPSLSLQNIFDEGHAIHAKWQKRFQEMGNLYGEWACLECEHVWWDVSPQECPSCTMDYTDFFVYQEVPLSSMSTYRIKGHADGWVKGLGEDCLIEVKSIGAGTIRIEAPEIWAKAEGNLEDAWSNIKRPFGSHIRQGSLYLELAHQMFEDAPEEIVFLYELKSNQQIKEFVISRTPELVEDVLVTAARVVSAVDRGRPLPCSIDALNGCTKCRAYEVNTK